MQDEEQIRALIEAWAIAAHEGDLDTVMADHAADIVMFDVPPPDQGVRGIDAYRETWPPFFVWQARGAVFEIESWTSWPAPTSRSPTHCCDAVRARTWPATPISGCGSPSVSPRPTDAG
jgi:SnoaL-like domain